MVSSNNKSVKGDLLVLILTLSLAYTWSQSLGGRTNGRHSRVLQASQPDDPTRSLDNLGIFSNQQLDRQRNNKRGSGGGSGGRSSSSRGRIAQRVRPNQEAEPNPFEDQQNCDSDSKYRRIDGSCNNLQMPLWGAAKTPQPRMVPPNRYEDGINEARWTYFSSAGSLPSARTVSLSVFLTTSNISAWHSHLLMNFGQFLDHDLTLTPEGSGGENMPKDECCNGQHTVTFLSAIGECFPISVESGDPAFTKDCIPFVRSSPVPGLPNTPIIRYQLNDLTSFIDASQVYGSTNIISHSLRKNVTGELRSQQIGNEVYLPVSEDNSPGCPLRSVQSDCNYFAGDMRSTEQAGLVTVHTLLLREHNRIAKELNILNRGQWKDEQLYQTTRKILGAMLQRMSYREFLPIIIGNDMMASYGLNLLESGRFNGYSSSINPAITVEFSTAAYRFGHSLVRQTFSRSQSSQLDLKDMFDAFHTINTYGNDGILKGLAQDTIESGDRFLSSGIRDNLFDEKLDLGAFNIQRGRDHGLPSYNDVRRHFGLVAYTTFEGMVVGQSHNREAVDALNTVYPLTEDIELYPGGLSEVPLSGAIVGETFANIIAEQFKRLKYGDRFWHETGDPVTRFTDEQLAEIRKASIARLFCDNVRDPVVRRFLLRSETLDNPVVSCSSIPSMDLRPWVLPGDSDNTRKNNRRNNNNRSNNNRNNNRNNSRNRNVRRRNNRRRGTFRNGRGRRGPAQSPKSRRSG